MASAAMIQPPEVLRNIIELILFPDTSLSYTNRPLIHITGHPRAKILPLVYLCKAWYRAALPLLYRDILINRLPQLKSLNVTLQKPECAGIKFWLESVEIRDMFPFEIASSAFQDEIQTLLQTCPKLTKFAYTHCYRSQSGFYAPVYPWLNAPLTHLHLEYVNSQQEFFVALKYAAPTLHSLYVSLSPQAIAQSGSDKDILNTRLDLPQLHTLSTPQIHGCLVMISKWDMPALRRLLFSEYSVENTGLFDVFPSSMFVLTWLLPHHIDLFGTVASTVQVLEIWDNGSEEEINNLINRTPQLEHLILHSRLDEWTLSTPFYYPQLKWIDVWVYQSKSTEQTLEILNEFYSVQSASAAPQPQELSSTGTSNSEQTTPATIHSIRIFPKRYYQWTHLPLLDPPTSSSSTEPRVYESRHFEEQCTWHQWFMEDYRSEDKEDAAYRFNSKEELSDGSGAYSSDGDPAGRHGRRL
ncbi:hypothetical protein CVT24_011928 [Panaeolus cyanescens]|uniref:F-box domain-containing protein n=1 Tax=Panaeolus cyanescens TaxID=181874 RepID=A0A409VXS0_9AGAR|nr:hypothetical protein CVT24_011928 [Panaeolus cyanescens]